MIMKREIKFRGKSTDTGKWIYGFLSFFYTAGRDENGLILTDKAKIYSPEDCRCDDVWAETVGQFTGVKYNDREIYEHDLVECAGVLCEVVYSDKIGSFVLLEVLSQNLGNKPIGQMIDMFGIRYVGNIYDSPELLK